MSCSKTSPRRMSSATSTLLAWTSVYALQRIVARLRLAESSPPVFTGGFAYGLRITNFAHEYTNVRNCSLIISYIRMLFVIRNHLGITPASCYPLIHYEPNSCDHVF